MRPQPARARRLWQRVGPLLATAALAIVIALAWRSGHTRELVRLLRSIRPVWLLAAAALQAATYACDACVWSGVLRAAGKPHPFTRLYALAVAKLFVTQAVPSGGISGGVMEVRALANEGVPLDASMTALVANLVAFYVALAANAVVATIVLAGHGAARGPLAAIAAPFVVLVVAIPTLVLWLVRSGRCRRERWTRVPLVGHALGALGEVRPDLLRRPRLLARAVALQIATFAFDAATLWVMLLALGAVVSPVHALAAFIVAAAAELVGPIPGGLGAFEGGCILALHAFGVPVETALLATLLLRGFTFWLPMVPGWLVATRTLARA